MQQFDIPAFVPGLAYGGVVAVVGHVADHAQGVDLALAQPGAEAGTGEGAGHALFDQMVAMPTGHQWMQFGLLAAAGEQGRSLWRQVLHDHHRDAGSLGGVHGADDIGQRLLYVRVFDQQIAADVFVLHIDDDEGALRLLGHADLLGTGE
ncbi:hypothetical protein D3C78_1081740 [compost metagenome]